MGWIWLNAIPAAVLVLAAIAGPWLLLKRRPHSLTGDPRVPGLAHEAANTWHRGPLSSPEREHQPVS